MHSSGSEHQIALGQMIVVRIPQELIADPYLSVPGWEKLTGTNGLCRDKKRALDDPNAPTYSEGLDEDGSVKLPYRSYDEKACLLPYEEHLQRLNLKPEDPWLLVGIRNLGNNLRIIGYDAQRGVLELNGENATTSGREYCCLCKTQNGKLAIDRVRFPNGKPSLDDLVWAASGQELVWGGEPATIDKIIPYTYDLRHVWRIEGQAITGMGSHAYAGEHIEEMIDLFVKLSDEPPDTVADQLIKLAEKRKYKRQCQYLHSAIGVTGDGKAAILVQRHGRFEDIAKTLAQAGADRAIELDQGGSCSVIMGGTREFRPGRTIFASHYFRPRGLALLIFKLRELGRDVLTEDSGLLQSKGCGQLPEQ